MSHPQVSSLSSPSDLVDLYQHFFLLPRRSDKGKDRAEEEEEEPALSLELDDDVLDPTSVYILPPTSLVSRWSDARTRGSRMVDMLLARGSCPFALEATAALTSALVLDGAVSGPEDLLATVSPSSAAGTSSSGSFLGGMAGSGGDAGISMAHAMAIVRFVNGVVDE